MDVTLSFDNGPEIVATDQVLSILRKHDIQSTFFVLGSKLANPDQRIMAEKSVDEGHWIGNHTWSHKTPLGEMTDTNAAIEEVAQTQRLLADLAHPAKFFRPFGGGGNLDQRLLSQPVRRYLIESGYTVVLWNSVPRDWSEPESWVENALCDIKAEPWSVMVLHDLPTGAMARLDEFIQRAKSIGARFRQDFNPSVTPIVSGKEIADTARYTT